MALLNKTASTTIINEEYVRKALVAHPELHHKRTVEVALSIVAGKPCVARVNARACDTPTTRFFGRFLRDNYSDLAKNVDIMGDFYLPNTNDPFEELMKASIEWDRHRKVALGLKSGPGGWHRHGLRFLQKISTVDMDNTSDEKKEHHCGLDEDDQAPPSAPPTAPPTAPSTAPPSSPPPAPPPAPPLPPAATSLGVEDQPTPVQQILRCCWQPESGLVKFLKSKKLYAHAGNKQWRGIRTWMKTQEGRAWLVGAGLHPDGAHIDHVIPQSIGGVSHVFNAHFLPSGINSAFGDRFDEKKKRYLGRSAVAMALAVGRWHSKKVEEGVDFTHFDAASAFL